MKRKPRAASLVTLDARNQAKIAVVLLAVIPSLSLFYICVTVMRNPDNLSPWFILLTFILTLSIAFFGFLVLKKYPNNILKLRQYITEIAQGTLPEKIQLTHTQDSDDIRYIEDNFNCVLAEMRHRMEIAEEQFRVEHALRKTIEQQQETLLEAERQRVMIQTLGAACHHIGQPATVLQIQMDLLLSHVTADEEIEQIKECAQEVHKISDILQQLQRTSTFRSIPYIDSENPLDEQIIAITEDMS